MPLCIYKTRFEKTEHKNAETPDFSGVSGECIYFGHSIWQREKDSNPHIRSQSPLCYLYTIPLCPDEQKLLYRFHGVCQQFFPNFSFFLQIPFEAARNEQQERPPSHPLLLLSHSTGVCFCINAFQSALHFASKPPGKLSAYSGSSHTARRPVSSSAACSGVSAANALRSSAPGRA